MAGGLHKKLADFRDELFDLVVRQAEIRLDVGGPLVPLDGVIQSGDGLDQVRGDKPDPPSARTSYSWWNRMASAKSLSRCQERASQYLTEA